MNPWDLNSGRRITHVGIYRTLSDVSRNPMYDKAAITRLKEFFSTPEPLSKDRCHKPTFATGDHLPQRVRELAASRYLRKSKIPGFEQ